MLAFPVAFHLAKPSALRRLDGSAAERPRLQSTRSPHTGRGYFPKSKIGRYGLKSPPKRQSRDPARRVALSAALSACPPAPRALVRVSIRCGCLSLNARESLKEAQRTATITKQGRRLDGKGLLAPAALCSIPAGSNPKTDHTFPSTFCFFTSQLLSFLPRPFFLSLNFIESETFSPNPTKSSIMDMQPEGGNSSGGGAVCYNCKYLSSSRP